MKKQVFQFQIENGQKKKNKTTVIPEYEQHEGPIDVIFYDCETATDIFLKLLGKSIDDIVYQTNLYATQQNKPLNLTKNELLSFIGINFMMSYHQLPSWKLYWNSSSDLGVPFITNCMTRNRFEQILRYLHCNDNSAIPRQNKDKIYKVRPLVTTLNENFKSMYKTTRCISIDESIIRVKGRSSLKQYNPQKPIKRGYKLWCVGDQKGFISSVEVYQGKNEELEKEFQQYVHALQDHMFYPSANRTGI